MPSSTWSRAIDLCAAALVRRCGRRTASVLTCQEKAVDVAVDIFILHASGRVIIAAIVWCVAAVDHRKSARCQIFYDHGKPVCRRRRGGRFGCRRRRRRWGRCRADFAIRRDVECHDADVACATRCERRLLACTPELRKAQSRDDALRVKRINWLVLCDGAQTGGCAIGMRQPGRKLLDAARATAARRKYRCAQRKTHQNRTSHPVDVARQLPNIRVGDLHLVNFGKTVLHLLLHNGAQACSALTQTTGVAAVAAREAALATDEPKEKPPSKSAVLLW